MPIKWTDQAHLTLLLKLLEVNPITKFDTEAIAATWPGAEKPTPRAIYEQIKNLRKRAEASSNGGGSSNSAGAGKGKSKAKGKIEFKASKPAATKFSATKRSGNNGVTKKRKLQMSDDESEEEAVESSATATDVDAELGDGGVLARNLPVRKSRTTNYNLDASDSEGLPDAAARTNSDSDSAFAPDRSERTHQQMEQGRVVAGEQDDELDAADEAFKMFTRGDDQVDGAGESRDDSVMGGDSGEDADEDEDEDVDDDGARSMTTMATRRTSWVTACEEMGEY